MELIEASGFTTHGYEITFLQWKPISMCVIRSTKVANIIYTGIARCNPSDKFSYSVGRDIAIERAFEQREFVPFFKKGNITLALATFPDNKLPKGSIMRKYKEYKKFIDKRSV